MTDIVERLRDKNCCDTANCNCDEAADEIEQLREALRRIAHSPNGPKTFCRDGHEEAFLIARAALGEDK